MSHQFTTWNYVLSFRGWAQCRMATDPDPSNELRGVSGYTFALPGEPDFTQIVYFQNCNDVIQRSSCPDIGVWVSGGRWYRGRVTEQVVDGFPDRVEHFETEPAAVNSDSPFWGAAVDLRNQPIFDSRNSTIVYDGYGLLSPFDLEIRSADAVDNTPISISRSYFVDPNNPTTDMESIPIEKLTPHIMSTAVYNAEDLNASTPGSPDILLESGIINPSAYRQQRLDNLLTELDGTEDRTARAALKKRIAELRIDDPKNRRTAQLGAKVLVPYNLNGRQATVNGLPVAAGKPWSLEMWIGGWDTDALSFFVMGTVKITLEFDPLAS